MYLENTLTGVSVIEEFLEESENLSSYDDSTISFEGIGNLSSLIGLRMVLAYTISDGHSYYEEKYYLSADIVVKTTYLGEVGECVHFYTNTGSELRSIILGLPEILQLNIFQKAGIFEDLLGLPKDLLHKFEACEPSILGLYTQPATKDFSINKFSTNSLISEYNLEEGDRIISMTLDTTMVSQIGLESEVYKSMSNNKNLLKFWITYIDEHLGLGKLA